MFNLRKICIDFLWLKTWNNENWSYCKHSFLCNDTNDHFLHLKFCKVLCPRTKKHLQLRKAKEARVAVNREQDSSIVKWCYQENPKPFFFFFFTKRLCTYKNANQIKTQQQNKTKQTKNNKRNNFLHVKTSKRVVGLICIFVCMKSFHKKK